MHYDRFDIALAWYHYCAAWHSGTRDWRYTRLVRINEYFKPGNDSLYELAVHSPNAFEIYLDIVRRYEGEDRAIEERVNLTT